MDDAASMGNPLPVISFPAESPHAPELTELVEDLASKTFRIEPHLKVFFYVDNKLGIPEVTITDFLADKVDPFSGWFPDYAEAHKTWWEESDVVVYSDTIPDRDEIRFHVVLGADLPVYALAVNRTTGEAQWYLQETPAAELLASRKRK